MRRAVPLALEVLKTALKTPGLKIVFGTGAVASGLKRTSSPSRAIRSQTSRRCAACRS